MYSCKILLDSISETGKRITTFEITFPRIVLAEFNTHRMFSRNSASSRAIPFRKQLERVILNPFIPEKFPCNGKGMQPEYYIDEAAAPKYRNEWIITRDEVLAQAEKLNNMGVHKQIVNRLLEPFMWHTVIVTATEFDNFFKLRTHPDAQYEIKRIADLMYDEYHFGWNTRLAEVASINQLKVGEWHCPLVYEEDIEPISELASGSDEEYIEIKKKISVARCARVSYLTHDGKRSIEKDLELFERLRTSGHWSPFEHVATPYFEKGLGLHKDYKPNENSVLTGLGIYSENLRSGNFLGWKQYRKEFQDENCTNFRKEN